MMKSESFSWRRTSRVCNGLYDFGLLRDKSNEKEQKAKLFPIFSRSVFIIGIIAGITFMVCLLLVDKYQKSVNASHHYARFTFEKGREELFENRKRYNITPNKLDMESIQGNSLMFSKTQNLSKSIMIDEINHLMPITTVLYSVNNSERTGKNLQQKREGWPNLNELNKNINGIRLKNFNSSKRPSNLAELLKRTEVQNQKLLAKSTTTEINDLQFAELQSYRHYLKMKNLQDVLNYVSCSSRQNCENGSSSENEDDLERASALQHHQQEKEADTESDVNHLQAFPKGYLSNFISDEETEKNDLNFADATIPLFFAPLLPPQLQQQHRFDQFYHYRTSSPVEINAMDQSINNERQSGPRFSNRIYQRPELQEQMPRISTEGGLDAYLKPPTPPPNTISFTPAYSSIVFHNFNEASTDGQEDSKPEGTAADPVTQVKPISLMVEIFPANDYELPDVNNKYQQQSHAHSVESASIQSPSVISPPLLPWKISQPPQNRIRLFVNLFPQIGKKPTL